MSAKFLADANFDLVILAAAKRREPGLDFQTASDTGLAGLEDPDMLAVAARVGRVLLTHDVRPMPRHFAAFIGEQTSTVVALIPQSVPNDLRKETVVSRTNSDTWFYLKAMPCGSGAVFSTLESRMSVRVFDSQPFSNGHCIEFRVR